jgi:hypothetical protein
LCKDYLIRLKLQQVFSKQLAPYDGNLKHSAKVSNTAYPRTFLYRSTCSSQSLSFHDSLACHSCQVISEPNTSHDLSQVFLLHVCFVNFV